MEIKGNINAGYSNVLSGSTTKSSILGGEINIINNATYSSISSGKENIISNGFAGSGFIGGGYRNKLTSLQNFIGSGYNNKNHSFGGFIGSGNNNQTSASYYSSIVNGRDNTIQSASAYSTIGGGNYNSLISTSISSFIGSGTYNQIDGNRSTIAGGANNDLSGDWGFIGSGSANTLNANYSFIGGGQGNQIPSALATRSSIVGGNNNQIRNADSSFIGGGDSNILRQNGSYTFIGGGKENIIGITGATSNNGTLSSIVGGYRNYIKSGGKGYETISGFIGGGQNNTMISGYFPVIGGGYGNSVSGDSSVVVGGYRNQVSSPNSFIGGGKDNYVGNSKSFIGGGSDNIISGNSVSSIIIGGRNNTNVDNYYGFMGGGRNNKISIVSTFPYNNTSYSSIIGGHDNTISQYNQYGKGGNTILGGKDVIIEGYTFNGYNVILAGGSTYWGGVGGRKGATINQGSGNFIGNGGPGGYGFNVWPNMVASAATHGIFDAYNSSVVNGYGNVIDSSNQTSVLNGTYNLIRSSSDTSIIGGVKNYIKDSNQSFIGSGYENSIKPFTNTGPAVILSPSRSSIISGNQNAINGFGNSNFIGSGQYLNIFNSVDSSIVGGRNNVIGGNVSTGLVTITPYNIYSSAILGGKSNVITGATSDYSSIVGGFRNTINNSRLSSIVGGSGNTVNHVNSHIIGSNITSVSANTTYVERFNIGTVDNNNSLPNVLVRDNDGTVRYRTAQSIANSFTGNTNFANTNLTFTGNRDHDLNGNELYIYDSTGLNGSGPYLYYQTSGNPYISIGYGDHSFLDIGNYLGGTGFTFNTNGVQRMQLDSNGNLGIGTTPTEKLDVSGKTKTTNFQMTSGATNGYVLTSDASGNASWKPQSVTGDTNFANTNLTFNGNREHNTNGNSFQITTDGGNFLQNFIYLSGNVGIGGSEFGFGSSYTDWRSTSVDHYLSGVKRIEVLTSETVFNNSGGNYDFRVEGDADTHLLFVDASTDEVAIGTNNPLGKLHIQTTENNPVLVIDGLRGTGLLGKWQHYTAQADISTTGTTTANITTIPLSLGNKITLTGKITASGIDTTVTVGGTFTAVASQEAGTASIIGTVDTVIKDDSAGNPSFNVVASGSNIIIQVTGGGESLSWLCTYEYQINGAPVV